MGCGQSKSSPVRAVNGQRPNQIKPAFVAKSNKLFSNEPKKLFSNEADDIFNQPKKSVLAPIERRKISETNVEDLLDDVQTEEEEAEYDPDPPIRPPRQTRDHMLGRTDLTVPDTHAMNVPDIFNESVNLLAKYLCHPAKNDLERVRAIFKWVAEYIRYDTNVFTKNRKIGSQDAASVLKRKTAVCEGYSKFFQALCLEVKIPCRKISGFSKALGYDPEVEITADQKPNHAWNIVYVKGDWWPVDVTWAAGTVNNATKKFTKNFTDFYFLTEPKDFVVKHFPYMDKSYCISSCFQLMGNPLTVEEFDKAICPNQAGIEFGFRSLTHRQVVEFDKVCELQVSTTKLKLNDMACHLVARDTGEDYRNYVLLRKLSDGLFSVKVTPPGSGTYDLTLFGKTDNAQKLHPSLIAYVMRCNSVMMNVGPYPEHWGTWGVKAPPAMYGFKKDFGHLDVLTATAGRTEIKVKVMPKIQLSFDMRHAEDKRDDLSQFIMAFIKDETLYVKFRFPIPGFYRFRFFAKNLQTLSETHDYVGDILIKSRDAHHDTHPYPKHQGIWGLREDPLQYGIMSSSHHGEEVTTVDGKVVMKFKVDPKIRISFKVEYAGMYRGDMNRLKMCYIEGDILYMVARLPFMGYYKLQVFARNLAISEHPNDDFIGQFLLNCTEKPEDVRKYPVHFGPWGAKREAVEHGFDSQIFKHNLISAKDGEIHLKLPVDPSISVSFKLSHAEEDIPDINRHGFSYIELDTLHILVRLPFAGFYCLKIYARQVNDDTSAPHNHIGDFLLENTTNIRGLKPFPETHPKADEYACVLLEPLCGNLPANQDVRIRVTSDLAMRMMVNKILFHQGDDSEFDMTFTTPGRNEHVTVFASAESSGPLHGIYRFKCV